MDGLLGDCRHALRLHLRTPGASLIAVCVLALGMAFVGAFLSLYVDLVLRPEPAFEQSRQLATAGQNGGPRLFGLPLGFVDRMSSEMSSIEAVAAAYGVDVLVGPDRAQGVASLVSGEFFYGLRPRLALGRGIRPEEDTPGADPVAVISYRLWQDRFGGDSAVLGDVIELTRDSRTPYLVSTAPGSLTAEPSAPERETTLFSIVGVMAEPLPSAMGANADLWIALDVGNDLFIGSPDRRDVVTVPTFVRKRAGVSAAAVADELMTRYDGEVGLASRIYPGVRLDVIDGIVEDITVKRAAERQLEIFLAGSVLLALVAAGNVSLFLLARAPGRRRELGIRMSVGAPFRRIARQLATEAGLLVVVSAAVGLVASTWLGAYVRTLPTFREANWRDVSLLDWRVLGVMSVFVVVLTLLVSLTPLPGIRRLGIGAASRQTTARALPLQRVTGTAQIAAAGALSAAAIAFGWYLGALIFGDPGYEIANRHLVRFRGADPAANASLESHFVELERRRTVIGAIPGVEGVGFGNPIPGADPSMLGLVRIDRFNDPSRSVAASTGMVDTGFAEVLGLDLVRGRLPAAGDSFDSSGPVMLVNQAFARAVFGREDVVGEHLDNAFPGSWTDAEIIGVLADVSFEHPSAAAVPYVFFGVNNFMGRLGVVETRMSAANLRAALDGLVTAGALETQIVEVRPLRAVRNEMIATDRARSFLAILAAVLVVLLTAFGYYGTQRYLVAAGRREYAIRAALGAGPRSLGRLVVSRALLMGTPGLALGALLAFTVVTSLRGDYLSDSVSPAVVTVAVGIALGLLLIASSLGPARQAKRTEPAALLRDD